MAGQVPIDRANADAAQAALDTAQRLLEDGKLLGMYPEAPARRTAGSTGAEWLARLALETGVPVIPVAMVGTDVVNPPGSKMWRFGRWKCARQADSPGSTGWPATASSNAP